MAVPDEKVQRAYRVRISLFLLAVCLAAVVSVLGYQATRTLRVLEVVERGRDRWQQAERVVDMLDLKTGNVVADVGSGAEYFTFKLAPIVGANGAVLAEDILTEPLVFLWLRALLRRQGNVHVIHGGPDDPHLPQGQIDAVLVANAYHEFTHPRAVLNRLFLSLHPAGRLVIVDRGPLPGEGENGQFETQHHERDPSGVETEIRKTGFALISRDDYFIAWPTFARAGDRADNRPWWIIVARKP
jgi:SAM-dependent methyltransferase